MIDSLKPGEAIASMGYPDILFPGIGAVLGEKSKDLKYREDSEEICQRHGFDYHPVPDAESFFELFGVSLDVYDIKAERGGEIVLDLNKPFPENSKGQYDYVLDVGTLEHCFNVPQAAQNMAALLKVGGLITHETPFNWGNHGFYSLHPTWFYDFYEANGFVVEDCRLTRGDQAGPTLKTQRFVYEGPEAVLVTTARRKEIRDFVFPTQRKYQ